jgi:hypothetical protein
MKCSPHRSTPYGVKRDGGSQNESLQPQTNKVWGVPKPGGEVRREAVRKQVIVAEIKQVGVEDTGGDVVPADISVLQLYACSMSVVHS